MNKNSNKTTPSQKDVDSFIDTIDDEQKRADSRELTALMSSATGQQPVLWGASIIGFGQYHYRYASGREGDYFRVGFSPRKATISIYLMNGTDKYQKELKQLGPHKTAVSCLYIKRLSDIDLSILASIIRQSCNDPAMGEPSQSSTAN